MVTIKNLMYNTMFIYLRAAYGRKMNQSQIYRKTGLQLPYNVWFERAGLIKREKFGRAKVIELTQMGLDLLKIFQKMNKNLKEKDKNADE